jgi:pimeloyl-ACP methyl ester carboxylesterase
VRSSASRTDSLFDWVNNQPGGFEALPSAAKRMHLDNGRTIRLELQTSTPTTHFSCAMLGTVKAPVVITYGTLTRVGFKVFAEAAHRCIAGSTLVPIEEARHGAPNQQPAVFNRLLVQFLDGRNAGK